MSIEVLKRKDFERIIKIKFNNILDGLDRYEHIELSSSKNSRVDIESEFINIIESFFALNDGKLIIDFYKQNLNEESIEYIKKNLDIEDIKVFDELFDFCDNENIYYSINSKKYLSLLVKLNTRELFFTTFYFYKYPITIWGNYNFKFPIFYDKYSSIKNYINILDKNT